jgi:hypothetical protein
LSRPGRISTTSDTVEVADEADRGSLIHPTGQTDPMTAPGASGHNRWMPDDARAAVDAIARAHHGVVTQRAALVSGMTRAQLRTDIARGRWRRAAAGTLVSTSAPDTWHQRMAIATLSTGGTASHRAAARLHQMDGPWGDLIELTVVRNRRVSSEWVVHRVGTLNKDDLITADGIQVTTLARTLCDLGAVVDDDVVEQALDDVLRRGVSQRWIERTLDRVDRPGPSGTAALRRVLRRADRSGPIPDSMFERLMERACVEAGLPQPERQIPVRDSSGAVVAVIDAGWPSRLVGSEAQSERWHGGPRGAQRDLDRHNLLTAMGWRMLYATWADVLDPRRYTAVLRALYERPR